MPVIGDLRAPPRGIIGPPRREIHALKRLNAARQVLRLHHDSMHTERSSVERIGRCVRFHRLRSRDDLFPAAPTIESCLTDLAMHRNVAAATQHQAMHALVFLDTRVLNHALEGSINAVRADKKINVPVVMTREVVAAVISLLDGTAPRVATRLYGRGLRIMEAVRLRVVAKQFFGALLARYQYASGSHGSPSSAKGSATGG